MERTAYDESTDDPVQHLLPQHVKRALVYMRSNVAEKITLPGLAANCAIPERGPSCALECWTTQVLPRAA